MRAVQQTSAFASTSMASSSRSFAEELYACGDVVPADLEGFIVDDDAPIEKAESSEDEDREYIVEKILQMRRKRGVPEYYVVWKGYPGENTWEPKENLTNCQDMLDEFIKKHKCPDKGSSDSSSETDDWNGDGKTPKKRKKKPKKKKAKRNPRDDTSSASEPENDKLKRQIYRAGQESKQSKFTREMKNLAEKTNSFPELPPAAELATYKRGRYESLGKREWISNFILDDMIPSLIRSYDLQDKVAYVPTVYFKYLQNRNFYKELCQFLHKNKILQHDITLIVACTGTGETADHWMLGIIAKNDEKIIVVDSLEDDMRRYEVFRDLGLLAHLMYRVENLTTDVNLDWKFVYSKDCRLQRNSHDCGLFVLLNVFSILQREKPPKLTSAQGRKWIFNHLETHPALEDFQDATSRQRRSAIDDKLLGKVLGELFYFRDEFSPDVILEKTNRVLRKELLKAEELQLQNVVVATSDSD